MHLVQLSFDDSVFHAPDGEASVRQQRYGSHLARISGGSTITLLVITSRRDVASFQRGHVSFVPFVRSRVGLRKPVAWVALYKTIACIDQRNRIDVLTSQTVHDEAWVALAFGLKHRRPVIGQVHSDIFSPQGRQGLAAGVRGACRYAVLLRVLRRFTGLRVVGHGIAREIARRGLHDRVHVIPVSMGLIGAQRHAPERHEGVRRVLFVGRLTAAKNLHDWLQVARLVAESCDDVLFEIVGKGEEEAELRTLAAVLGLADRVRFAGFIPNEQLPAHYASASVLLLTSGYEGFGRVAAEAFAHGVPVVAPRITGLEDIVRDGESGFLLSPGDIEGMARKVCWLLDRPEARRAMGLQGAIDVRDRYAADRLASDWMSLLVGYAHFEDPRPSLEDG